MFIWPIFSSSVILPSKSATLLSMGCLESRYKGAAASGCANANTGRSRKRIDNALAHLRLLMGTPTFRYEYIKRRRDQEEHRRGEARLAYCSLATCEELHGFGQ